MEYYKISNAELINLYYDCLILNRNANSDEALAIEDEFLNRIFYEKEIDEIKLIGKEVGTNIYLKLHTKLENFKSTLTNYTFSEEKYCKLLDEYESISKQELIHKFLKLKDYIVEARKVIIEKMKQHKLVNPSNLPIINFLEKNNYLFCGTETIGEIPKKIPNEISNKFYEVYTNLYTNELKQKYLNWKDYHLEEIKIIEDELLCRGYPHLINETIKATLEKKEQNIVENNIYHKEAKKYLDLNLKRGNNPYNSQMKVIISLFLAFGVMLITYSIAEFITQVDTIYWQENIAIVTKVDIQEKIRTFTDKETHIEKKETYEVGNIYYEYKVNGTEYINSFEKTTFTLGSIKKEYPEGTQLEIYYNPKNPEYVTREIYSFWGLMCIPIGVIFLKIFWWMRKKYELEGSYRHITLKDIKKELIVSIFLIEIAFLWLYNL